MLASWLGRSGIKGNGTGYPARVGLNDVNAYWDGSITNYGHSTDNARQLTAIDIVAHENGHGIFYTTPGGSNGDNETGGMNESTGDIFGAMTECVRREPQRPGRLPGRRGGQPHRQRPDPQHVQPERPRRPELLVTSHQEHRGARRRRSAEPLVLPAVAGLERLAGQSPTCNGSTVTGLGIQTAGKIFYNGLLLKTSSWTHAAARKVATLTGRGQPLRHHATAPTSTPSRRPGTRSRCRRSPVRPTCGGGGDAEHLHGGDLDRLRHAGLLDVQAVLVGLLGRGRHDQGLPDRARRASTWTSTCSAGTAARGWTSRPVRARRRPRRSPTPPRPAATAGTSTRTPAPARSR